MADVISTGYFAASRFVKGLPEAQLESTTAVVLGCGPVGICAIASAIYFTGGKAKIFAVDSIPERLEATKKLSAIPTDLSDNAVGRIKGASSGRSVDIVIEVVGHADALGLAFDLIRPFGKISSIGVHSEGTSFPRFSLYSKNFTITLGKCQIKMRREDGPSAFKMFEKQKVHKIIFAV